jgi:hypothetical protein
MAEKAMEQVEAEIKAIQLETAQLELEEARERIEAHKAGKEVRSRQNAQRQGQLRTDLRERATVIASCTHRQGGSPGRERKGSGPSALRIVILPDNRTLVMCANCPLRVFSPYPGLKNPQQLPGETKAKREARLQAFAVASAEFEKLTERSQDQLTPEAATPMHCGKQFSFVAGNGNQVAVPAPCDSYSQGTDNRKIA